MKQLLGGAVLEKIFSKKYRKFIFMIAIFIGTCFWAQTKDSYWVYADGEKVSIHAAKWQNDKDIIALAGYSLNKDDRYIAHKDNVIEVIRAVKVTIFDKNGKQEVLTSELTIADTLNKLGLKSTKIYPDKLTQPTENMNIFLLEENETVVLEQKSIPFKTVNQPDNHLEAGNEKTIFEGENGSKTIIAKVVTLENGNSTKTEMAEENVVLPKDKIVALGKANTVATSRGTERFSKVITMEATAYTPWDAGCTGITRMGIPAKRGIVAVDPDVIPLGTRVYIPGYGYALAADTGGAIVGNKIDLCVESTNEAFSFGRRSVKVYILE